MRKIMLVIEDYKELVALENLLRRVGFDVMSLGKDVLVNDALLRFHPDIVIATARGRAVDGLRVAARVKKISPAPRVALAYIVGNAPNLTAEAQALVEAMIVTPIQPATVIKVIGQLGGLDSNALVAKYEKLMTSRPEDEAEMRIISGEEREPVEMQIITSSNPQSARSTPASSQRSPAPSDDPLDVFDQPLAPSEAKTTTGHSNTTTGAREPQAALDEDPWAKNEEEWDPAKAPGKAATVRSLRSDRYDRFLAEMDPEPVDGVLPREKAAQAMRKLKRAAEKDKAKLDQLDEEKRAFVRALFDPGSDSDE